MTMDTFPGPNAIVPSPPSVDFFHWSFWEAANVTTVISISATIAAQVVGSTISTAVGAKISTTQLDFIAGGVSLPAVQDYRIIDYLPYTVTFQNIYAKLETGNLTAVFKMNATTITGGTTAIGTSQMSSILSSPNTGAIGATLVMSITTTSGGPTNLSFVVTFDRPLATTA